MKPKVTATWETFADGTPVLVVDDGGTAWGDLSEERIDALMAQGAEKARERIAKRAAEKA